MGGAHSQVRFEFTWQAAGGWWRLQVVVIPERMRIGSKGGGRGAKGSQQEETRRCSNLGQRGENIQCGRKSGRHTFGPVHWAQEGREGERRCK